MNSLWSRRFMAVFCGLLLGVLFVNRSLLFFDPKGYRSKATTVVLTNRGAANVKRNRTKPGGNRYSTLQPPKPPLLTSTLGKCVSHTGKIIRTEQDIVIDFRYRGDVVLQVDNRPVFLDSPDRWNQSFEGGLLYNNLMAEKYNAKYLLVYVNGTCKSPHDRELIGYWCKVPGIRAALKMYPNAKSILFLDSDAYLSTAREFQRFYRDKRLDFSSTSPIYAFKEFMFWRGVLEWNDNVYHDALNTGVLVLNPKSKNTQKTMDLWWHESTKPDFLSPLEAFRTYISVDVLFNNSCTFSAQDMYEKYLPQLLWKAVTPYLSNETKKHNMSFVFDPDSTFKGHRNRSPHIKWTFSTVEPCKLSFKIGSFYDKEEITRVQNELRLGTPLLDSIEEIMNCSATSVETLRQEARGGALDTWPGDQERLQWIKEIHPEYITALAGFVLVNPNADFEFHRQIAAHACMSSGERSKAAKNVMRLLRTQFFNTTDAMVASIKTLPTLCVHKDASGIL